MPDRFSAAVDTITHSQGRESQLSLPILDVVPVTGASISTIGDFLGTETVSASNSQAARLDELQFDLGEGPCFDAVALRSPVFEPALRDKPRGLWPAFSEAVRHEQVGSLFAFPLTLGSLQLGAMELYDRDPRELSEPEAEQAEALASIVSRVLLRRALRRANVDDSVEDNPFSRRIIHQATGMVLAQLDIPADDARLLIQGHAFAAGRAMRDVARDIVDGLLDLEAADS